MKPSLGFPPAALPAFFGTIRPSDCPPFCLPRVRHTRGNTLPTGGDKLSPVDVISLCNVAGSQTPRQCVKSHHCDKPTWLAPFRTGFPPVKYHTLSGRTGTAAHSKECKRSPQQFIPAGFPLTTISPRGRKTQPAPPSPHRPRSVPDASSILN